MQSFAAFTRGRTRGAMEELYTETFDVTPAATLHAGYHLFGDSPKRSAFLVRLREEYESHGMDVSPEQADHLSVILRFLSIARDREFAVPLLRECVLPMVQKLDRFLSKGDAGYGAAVGTLRRFLGRADEKLTKGEGVGR